jgi:hypothetical protein
MNSKPYLLFIFIVIALPCVSMAGQSEQYAAAIKAQSERNATAIKAQSERNATAIKAQSERNATAIKAQSERNATAKKAQSERNATAIKAQSERNATAIKAQSERNATAIKAQSGQNAVVIKAQLEWNTASTQAQLGWNTASTQAQLGWNKASTMAQLEQNAASTRAQLERNAASTQAQLEHISNTGAERQKMLLESGTAKPTPKPAVQELRAYSKETALGTLKVWLELEWCNSTNAFTLQQLGGGEDGTAANPYDAGAGVFSIAAQTFLTKDRQNKIDSELKAYEGKSLQEIDARVEQIKKDLNTNDPLKAKVNSWCQGM